MGGFHIRETQAENGATTKKSELVNEEKETRFLVMPLSQEIKFEAYRLFSKIGQRIVLIFKDKLI